MSYNVKKVRYFILENEILRNDLEKIKYDILKENYPKELKTNVKIICSDNEIRLYSENYIKLIDTVRSKEIYQKISNLLLEKLEIYRSREKKDKNCFIKIIEVIVEVIKYNQEGNEIKEFVKMFVEKLICDENGNNDSEDSIITNPDGPTILHPDDQYNN